jgi:hypothetical protein
MFGEEYKLWRIKLRIRQEYKVVIHMLQIMQEGLSGSAKYNDIGEFQKQ